MVINSDMYASVYTAAHPRAMVLWTSGIHPSVVIMWHHQEGGISCNPGLSGSERNMAAPYANAPSYQVTPLRASQRPLVTTAFFTTHAAPTQS